MAKKTKKDKKKDLVRGAKVDDIYSKPAKAEKGQEVRFEDVLASNGLAVEKINKSGLPDQQEYLDRTDLFLPFSTSLRADHYLKLKRAEYWNRLTIREIFEKVLEEGLKQFPNLDKKLPEKVTSKLKPLKTATDYYQERVTNKTGEGYKKKKEDL